MPTTRLRRTLAASPADIWRLVGDPTQLPRWWPRVVRVEGAGPRAFTMVMTSSRGREVRADQVVLAHSRPRRRAWGLVIDGTPFERVFAQHEVELGLEETPDGTVVTAELRQRMKGASRLGGVLARRGARKQLRTALDALERELGPR